MTTFLSATNTGLARPSSRRQVPHRMHHSVPEILLRTPLGNGYQPGSLLALVGSVEGKNTSTFHVFAHGAVTHRIYGYTSGGEPHRTLCTPHRNSFGHYRPAACDTAAIMTVPPATNTGLAEPSSPSGLESTLRRIHRSVFVELPGIKPGSTGFSILRPSGIVPCTCLQISFLRRILGVLRRLRNVARRWNVVCDLSTTETLLGPKSTDTSTADIGPVTPLLDQLRLRPNHSETSQISRSSTFTSVFSSSLETDFTARLDSTLVADLLLDDFQSYFIQPILFPLLSSSLPFLLSLSLFSFRSVPDVSRQSRYLSFVAFSQPAEGATNFLIITYYKK